MIITVPISTIARSSASLLLWLTTHSLLATALLWLPSHCVSRSVSTYTLWLHVYLDVTSSWLYSYLSTYKHTALTSASYAQGLAWPLFLS